MTNKEAKTIQEVINSQPTIAARKRMAKAIGVPYKHPTPKDQIHCKGTITGDYKRGRAIHGRVMAVIPAVTLSTGRVVPELAVDPTCIRQVAMELLRMADKANW